MRRDPLLADDVHQQLAESVARCCARRPHDRRWSGVRRPIWGDIADIGVFELGHAGRAGDAVAACAALGREGVFGPLPATLLAGALLDSAIARAVIDGTSIATVAAPAPSGDWLIPWGPQADVVLMVDEPGTTVTVGEVTRSEALTSISGEPWLRASLDPVGRVELPPALLARCWLTSAAWMVGAAMRAIDELHEYVHHRRQFGRPIADFQAVSHPVAESSVTLLASAAAIARGADQLDEEESWTGAAAACVGAGPAAVDAVLVAHQAYGAIAFIEEGPLGMTAMRVREMASLPPGATHATAWLASAVLDDATPMGV